MTTRLKEGVKIVLENGNFPHSIQIFHQDEEICSKGIVNWPIDIHIDDKGAVATLRVPVAELHINGIAVIEEPKQD